MSIRHRLTLLTLVSMIGLCILCGVTAYVEQSLGRFVQRLVAQDLPSLQYLQRFEADTLKIHSDSLLLQTSDNADELQILPKRIADATMDAHRALQDYAGLAADTEDRRLLATDMTALAAYETALKPYLDAVGSGDIVESKSAQRKIGPKAAAVIDAADKHIQYNYRFAAAEATGATSLIRTVRIVSWGIALACLLVVGLIGWRLTRSIALALSGLQGAISSISDSLDFTRRAPQASADELGSTAQAFNRLIDRLQGSLSELAGNIHQVARAATTLADTSGEVARAAASQSDISANVAATVEQLTVSIDHVGGQASSTNAHAVEAGNLATSGGSVVGQTVNDIREIAATVRDASASVRTLAEHAQKIAASVHVIKDVADQTSLLALNAAIEAARAGEQGRGFAVVADEVRKLAERTTAMTADISAVIAAMSSSNDHTSHAMAATVARVESGVARADEAQHAIHQIGSTTAGLVDLVGDITGSIREQALASNEIATQVERIAQMAQAANTGAAAASSSAQQLDQSARQMQAIVAAYTL